MRWFHEETQHLRDLIKNTVAIQLGAQKMLHRSSTSCHLPLNKLGLMFLNSSPTGRYKSSEKFWGKPFRNLQFFCCLGLGK